MLDDLRNHDTEPNEQERAWMSVDPLAVLMRLAVLAILAVAIGLSATQIAAPPASDSVVAVQR
jgi:hypothetical protein